MKKTLLTIILFLTISISLGIDCSNLNPSDLNSAVINYEVTGDVNFFYHEGYSVIEYLNLDIKIIPQTSQSMNSYTGVLDYDTLGNEVLIYSQDEVNTSKIVWDYESIIYSNTSLLKLSSNPEFPYPVSELPNGVKEYTLFTETADNSSQISTKVNELLTGVNNYFEAISLLSEFVSYYLEYDPLYEPSSTPSSQIFNQQVGVCGEFSSLLISMLRTVGIPARFVSGFAYSNLGEATCTNFWPHSWVEVYVPDYGWIQIDPTYKEYFNVDAGHVKLYHAIDSSINIINGSVIRLNSDFEIEEPVFNWTLTNYSLASHELTIDTRFEPSHKVGIGDYVLLNATITNPYDEWILDSLDLTKTSDLIIGYGNEDRAIIIPPKTSKNYYYIFNISENLANDVVYTHPCSLNLLNNGVEEFEIIVDPRVDYNDEYSDFIQDISNDDRKYSSNLEVTNININPDKVLGEEPVLSFNLQNIGNTILEDINIGINYENNSINDVLTKLYILESEELTYNLSLPNTTGIINVNCNITANDLTLYFNKSFTKLVEAPFIFALTGEEEYKTNSPYELGLYFSQVPGDYNQARIEVFINNNEIVNEPFYFSTSTIKLNKTDFRTGDNKIQVLLNYYDSEGNEYLTRDYIQVNSYLQLTLWEKIQEFIKAVVDVFLMLLS